ncbi:MAG: PAS domain-containing protein, partial [Candidatus Thorarchaeota archaeon]
MTDTPDSSNPDDELLRYRAFIDSTNDGFGVIDGNGVLLFVNRRFGELLGYKPEEMVGKVITEFTDGKNKSILEKNIGKRKEGHASDYEISWIKKSGELIASVVSGAPLVDQNGEHRGSFAVISDISKFKQTKDALLYSEGRYRKLVESMHEGLIMCDENWIITYVNPSFEKMLGYKLREVVGKHFIDFIIDEMTDSVNRWIANRAKGLIQSFEVAWKSRDGRSIYTETTPRGLYDQDDKLFGFIGTLIDTTEKRKAESALTESEDRYRTLAEMSLQGLTVIQNSVYVYINPAFASIVGYTPGEILSWDSETQWSLIYPDDRQYLLDLAARRNAGDHVPSPYEYRLVRRDGTVRWVEAFSSNIVYGGEKALQVHVIDITERKIAQTDLKASQDMLQLVLKHIPQHIFWKDTSLIYLGCNENFARVCGAGTPENIIGKTDYDLAWRREEADKFRKIDREVIETGEPRFDRIDQQLQADGNDAWMRTTIVPLYDEKKNIIGIMGAQEDVTDKLEAEQVIKKSESKYRTLAEQSLQGLTVATDDGFLYVNRAFAEMVGRSIEDILNLKGEEVWSLLHPEDRPVLRERLIAMREKRPITPRHEYRYIRSDGSFRWMEA